MKALSVKQPWASLIAVGAKTIECRSWPTKYRGELLIRSSKGNDYVEYTNIGAELSAPGGMALAVVNLVNCRPMKNSDLEAAHIPEEWADDVLKGYAWELELQYEVIPVPIKGKLSIYNLDIEIDILPDKFLDHLVYLDYQKHGRFRYPEWEPEYWQNPQQ